MPQAAAALVPSQFELVPADPAGKFAIAQVVFAKYPFSNIGGYNEVAQTIVVTYKGTPGTYAVRLHVTNDQAMAAGREIGGFPKKIGKITLHEGPTYLSTLESPHGLQICTAELDPLQPVQGSGDLPTTFFSLRVIPNPMDVTQAVGLSADPDGVGALGGHVLVGRGTLHFTGELGAEPVSRAADPAADGAAQHEPPDRSRAEDPGVGLFRGKMKIAQVTVLEDF